jgi:hypothetical protein
MTPNQEMTIPRSGADITFHFVFGGIIVLFVVIALVNLYNRVALVASCIWLAFVTLIVWTKSKEEGGFRGFLTSWLGELGGRRFVESASHEVHQTEVRFGYEMLGHRFIQQRFAIGKIESIEWTTGQATAMAGRDMNDWHVCLWFDHDDPAENESQSSGKLRKLGQKVYLVGPSTEKKLAEALGISVVAFLRAAGADLVQSADACFVRREDAIHAD